MLIVHGEKRESKAELLAQARPYENISFCQVINICIILDAICCIQSYYVSLKRDTPYMASSEFHIMLQGIYFLGLYERDSYVPGPLCLQ